MVELVERLVWAVERAGPVPPERVGDGAGPVHRLERPTLNAAGPLAALPVATRRRVAQRLAVAALVAELALDRTVRHGVAGPTDAVRARHAGPPTPDAVVRAVA